MKNRIKKALMMTAIYLEIMASATVFSGCGNKSEAPNMTYRNMLSELEKDTLVDDVLGEFFKYTGSGNKIKFTTKDINKLERALYLSDKLHDMELTKKFNKFSVPTNIKKLSYSKIEEIIDSLDSEEITEKETIILWYNEGLINTWIFNNGYNIMIEYEKLLIKAKVLEVYNKEQNDKGYTELSIDEYKNMKIHTIKDGKDHKNSFVYTNENILCSNNKEDLAEDVIEYIDGTQVISKKYKDNKNNKYNERKYELPDSMLNLVDNIALCKYYRKSDRLLLKYNCIPVNDKNDIKYSIERNSHLKQSLYLTKVVLNKEYDYLNDDDGYHEIIEGKKLIK